MTLRRVGSQVGVVGQPAQTLDTNDETGTYLIPSVSLAGATYQLLTDAAATGDPVGPMVGGSYVWTTSGTFGGATVKLQYLGPDGTTYIDVASASMSSAGSLFIDHVGAGAIVKAVVSGGSPSGLYSSLT